MEVGHCRQLIIAPMAKASHTQCQIPVPLIPTANADLPAQNATRTSSFQSSPKTRVPNQVPSALLGTDSVSIIAR